jgi:catechol-2,3-dioxygenase
MERTLKSQNNGRRFANVGRRAPTKRTTSPSRERIHPMSVHSAENSATGHDETLAPDYLVHWVVKTARSKEMIAWYRTVFGARVVHEGPKLAFLTWDEESHRIALVKVPRLLRYLFPLARLRRKVYGVDHLGFTVRSLEQLLSTYERLKKAGITPVWSINHGPTTSL